MPIINSNTINIEELSRYPEGSLGKEYTRFLEKNVRYKCNLPFKVISLCESILLHSLTKCLTLYVL